MKKDKKAPKKITFENEEFIVDNWIECEKCKTWRVVSKNPRNYPYFTCKSINKKCKSKQEVPKNSFTIN